MALGTWLWIITIGFCLAFLVISWKVKDKATSSYAEYVIGGGSLPFFLIFFTQFATIMGVGNFVGHAASGARVGLPHMFFILGEQGSKIIFALFFAGLAGRFTYKTVSEMMDDLFVRDRVTRMLVGLVASLIMIAWVGGQGKAFGHIFSVITGANPTWIILFFSAVFILYTTLGGIYSVVWTDFLQGILMFIFGAVFYYYAFAPVDFSLTQLATKLAEGGHGNLWAVEHVNTMSLVTMFVTGCIGILAAQIYWQRCFAAKDGRTARNGLLYSGIIAILMVMLTALVGMVIVAVNPEILGADGKLAADPMSWFLQSAHIPTFVAAMIFALILAAGMSSADSNLNSAATLIVNDLVLPLKKDATDQELVRYVTIATVVVGIFAALAALYATTIIGLFSKAYSIAGGALVPLLLVGLLWKKRAGEEFRMGTRNSNITPWGARTGIVVGGVLTQVEALGAHRNLIALGVSALLIVVVSLLTKESMEESSLRA
jgi:SSS family solute:Na+ symporter